MYNAALEERRGSWRWERRRVTRFEQFRSLTGFDWEPLRMFGVCVARGTLTRVDEAFAGFFRRVAAGTKPGYPRFRSRSRFDSVSWPDRYSWKLDPVRKRLSLQGVGQMRVLVHAELRGTPKTLTVRRRGRHWECTVFCSQVTARPRAPTGREVGVDRGVALLAATSDGELIANPRPRLRLAETLAAAQADLARRHPGSLRYRLARAKVQAVRRREANVRRDACHRVSRQLVNAYELICLEKLRIGKMTRSAKGNIDRPGVHVAAKAGLNDAILDSGWGMLERFIVYKAEDAGRRVELVDPRHTSTTCTACGHRDKASAGRPSPVRVHRLRAHRPR